jgi:lysophospholipase L1-like esterase
VSTDTEEYPMAIGRAVSRLLQAAAAAFAILVCQSAGAHADGHEVSRAQGNVAPAAAIPMPLISQGLPIFASSAQYPAAYANDASYDTEWRSYGVPASISLDLSSVPPAERDAIWLVWYNDDTYGYDHTLIGEVGYNNPGAYSVDVNAAPGGGPAPKTGWVRAAHLKNNVLHSFSHFLGFSGYNWVRLSFTASDGSPDNTDIAINLDVYGASNGVTDGWFFNGDSITANCMNHGSVRGENELDPGTDITISTPSFGQQVAAVVANDTPLQENAGMAGFTAGQMIPYLGHWLKRVPSMFVTINLGTNDAAGAVAPAVFYANMQTLVEAVITAGKVPVVPTIPYSTDPTHLANIPGLNAQIQALYAANNQVVPGPDLWTFFENNPQYISSDHVHPNAQGCVAYRTLWAQFAAGIIYGQ